MKLVEHKIVDYINAVDSKSPTPGGGSVAAVVSALSAALIGMVAHLTVCKKKFLELDSSLQNRFNNNFKRIVEIKNELLELVDEDAISFNEVMIAYKLPKNTDDEKIARDKNIELATISATNVPIKILDLSIEILRLVDLFVDYGSKNALSDVGIGAILGLAGVKSAILNIKINLCCISDKTLVGELILKCDTLFNEANTIGAKVDSKMNECFRVII